MKHTFEVTMTVVINADDCQAAEAAALQIIKSVHGKDGLRILAGVDLCEELHPDEAEAADDGADADYDQVMQDALDDKH